MPLCCEGCDPDFKFCVGDEITLSTNDTDYTIMRRLSINNGSHIYQLMACDPTNSEQFLSLSTADEDNMTKTTCLDVLTKLWTNLPYNTNQQLNTLVLNKVLRNVCGSESHSVETSVTENSYCLKFDGIEFTKNK
jgi:hypothetical protein